MNAVDRLIDSLPRTSLIVGKGGVGKTTCAAGLATICAERGERTLLVSTDPAAALADALAIPVSSDVSAVDAKPNLWVRQLAARPLREDFLNRWRATIGDIIDRGTYLDREDIDGLVDAALPGGDEIFALLALADLLADPKAPYDRIVVDTAPTGHTLRLLALPETFRALLSMFDAMQNKHRFMVRALTHRYRRDDADAFIDEMRSRIETLRTLLANGDAVAAVVVTRAEQVVAAETRRYVESLTVLHVRVAAIVVNASVNTDITTSTDPSVVTYWLPMAEQPPLGVANIAAAVRALTSTANSLASQSRRASARPAQEAETVDLSTIVRTVTIVGGKGGVGKSTVACALAVASARAGDGLTLLVSTDPAPSIADAFGLPDAEWARADIEAELDDVPGLVVRQMDATAAFARVRDTYQSRIDSLFEAIIGRGVDVTADRAIIRDLLALAPPGVDELFALSTLGDALFEGRFRRIIVDPAPTGHLLRLLEMPAIALDWSHRIMRLMLKYREVVGLGETAQELLDFAKRTRVLDALLHDASQCGLVLVSLDEPLVRTETTRLAAAVGAIGIDVSAIIWNRVEEPLRPLPADVAAHQVVAEEVQPPPIGAGALDEWSLSWRIALPNS